MNNSSKRMSCNMQETSFKVVKHIVQNECFCKPELGIKCYEHFDYEDCYVYGCSEKGWFRADEKHLYCTEHKFLTGVDPKYILIKSELPKSFAPRLCANHFQYDDGSWGHCVPNFHKHDGECNWTRPDEAGFV